MRAFAFEHTHRFTEDEYVRVTDVIRPLGTRGYVWIAVLVAIGVLCLFSKYTLIPGILLLLLVVGLRAWLPRTVPLSLRQHFRTSKLLKAELTYGASERGVWIRGPEYSAWMGWGYLATWRTRNGWLMLTVPGIPTIFLPIARMSAEGVLSRVMLQARANGKASDLSDHTPAKPDLAASAGEVRRDESHTE